jgi:hypothetical protein
MWRHKLPTYKTYGLSRGPNQQSRLPARAGIVTRIIMKNLIPLNFLLIQPVPNTATHVTTPNGIVNKREWNLSNPRPPMINVEKVANPVLGIPVAPTKKALDQVLKSLNDSQTWAILNRRSTTPALFSLILARTIARSRSFNHLDRRGSSNYS